MEKYLKIIHENDLLKLLDKFGLINKLNEGKLKCKFTREIISIENIYCIFPESGDIKFVCSNPEAIKAFVEYQENK